VLSYNLLFLFRYWKTAVMIEAALLPDKKAGQWRCPILMVR
jgi:hypothetical protein